MKVIKSNITTSLLLILAIAPSLSIPQPAIHSSMLLHMAIQLPLLIAAGYSLFDKLSVAKKIPANLSWQLIVSVWIWVYFTIIFWMLPIHLDKALMFLEWDIAKILSLLFAGGLLRLIAGSPIVWGTFFVGSLAIGCIFLGVYYQQATVRVCSNYLIESQHRTGYALFLWGLCLLAFLFYKTKHRLLPQD